VYYHHLTIVINVVSAGDINVIFGAAILKWLLMLVFAVIVIVAVVVDNPLELFHPCWIEWSSKI